eukprot:TRINITY_DN75732_c0_g1_i1.p1 TRINITY_DN75732_c0_g1~~TRINITY_DN75732_c0_g1_i1.p1  ORF type:complete len:161 (+),score=67.27 TRINITY_DN75732_c0_g1_i1:24-485(+)
MSAVIYSQTSTASPGSLFPHLWHMPKLQKRFVSPYYLFTEDKKTADVPPALAGLAGSKTGDTFPHICEEMIRVGKRGVDQEEHDKRQTACLASLLGSVNMLEQLKGVCQDDQDNCAQEREGLAGEIIEAMNGCYSGEQYGGVMQSSPLVYRVI